MAENVQFNVDRINSIKDEIISELKIQGAENISHNCQQISTVLSTKNEEMSVIYSSFESMQEVMNSITDMMNADPEADGDSGSVYVKRR